jgi:hypothetical protein
LFHKVLSQALTHYQELGSAHLPANAQAFKRQYGSALARFEAARCASKQRAEIARFIVQKTLEALVYVEENGAVNPLLDYLKKPVTPAKLVRNASPSASGLSVEVPFEGKLWRGREVIALAERLFDAHQISRAACDALSWIVEHAAAHGGRISLYNQRFALLGAGAELAPTRLLLKAGASVLWVDPADPLALRASGQEHGGVLVYSEQARDLLLEPAAVLSAIGEFASKSPVHVGMFAYAGGESQEWRLGAAMNAITASLDPSLVRSVSLLVSPTSPGSLEPESVKAADVRRRAAPFWQRMLSLAGILSRPGHYEFGAEAIALATVSIQGLSYQAAQYISKIAAAESYAVFGTDLYASEPRSLTVSANVGGVTRTRSLAHPIFAAAFQGAPAFGVRIFDADTTRALSAYLMLHDLLNPNAPGAARDLTSSRADARTAVEARGSAREQNGDGKVREHAARIHTQQVHGGLYGLPYELEGVIRCAALVGASQKPSVLWSKPKQRAAGQAPTATTSQPIARTKPPFEDQPRS